MSEDSEKSLSKKAEKLKRVSLASSSAQFRKAWETIGKGYIGYGKTNADDLEALKRINTEFFGRTKAEMNSFQEAMDPVLGFLLDKTEVPWKKHFQEGKFAFTSQYEKSGKRGNSITGLWDILVGYASWTYKAIFEPSAKSIYHTTKRIPYYTVDMVSKTFIATSNVIHSLGANVFYTSKLGYRVISPSLEAGYLSSIALVNVLNAHVTSSAMKTVGLLNKVAIKGAAPVAGGAQYLIEESSEKAVTAATYLYHGTLGVSEVVLEKVVSGVVLSYSAVSQIPPQLLLTGVNSAIFLVYDGPRLVIVKASGNIADKNVDELPVGTVVDMDELKKSGVKVEEMSRDSEVIQKVLQHVE